ncbi:MAG: NUDIX domain-containing protein [Candidatus Nanoarchaeia archaeon]|nr:NUDIX domain-containing protein [Candidatus Nanoarchaeia archaeon]
MGLLDIVDEQDNVISKEDFTKVHSEGLRHRSVQVFVFEYPDYRYPSRLLIAQRSAKQETSSLKLHPSAGGHVRSGQSYEEAAIEEAREELFYDKNELPRGFIFHKVGELFEAHMPFYKNDTRPTNKENSVLFLTEYSGPFSPDPKEIEKVFWQDPEEVFNDMKSNPDKYTQSFKNAMTHYMFSIHSD